MPRIDLGLAAYNSRSSKSVMMQRSANDQESVNLSEEDEKGMQQRMAQQLSHSSSV